MDYAFAPGTSDYEGFLRSLLQARNNTTLISKAGLTSVSDFLGELVTEAVTAQDLVAGSHASDEGDLFLALDKAIVDADTNQTVPVTYEMLQAANTAGSIKIPAAVRSPTTSLHFKGCRIGADDSLPFLRLLKISLDNPQRVTAPKYFHVLVSYTGIGVFECMAYSYRVMNITAFPDRPTLIAAFVAGGFKDDLAGTPVPDASWTDWVKRSLKLKPANSDKVKFNFPVAITPKTGGLAAIPDLTAECRSQAEKFTYTLTVTGTIPTSDADRLALLKTALSAETWMQAPPAHLYPMYQRLHFPDFDTFWNSLSWKTSVNGSNLIGVGTHYVYTLLIPILKPGTTTSELLFNFYPTTGAPVMNFKEDNAAFVMFGVV